MTSTMTATQTTTLTDAQFVELEYAFWDALKARDAKEAGRLTDRDCTIVGASGVTAIDPASIGKMVEGAPYEFKGYRIDPQTTRIVRISDDVVAIAYGVHEDVEVDGKSVQLDAFNSSVWKRQGDTWTCVLHTESIAGDPFGRDRS